MIANHLQQVRQIAGQVHSKLPRHAVVSREDLVQAGLMGLLEAQRRFQANHQTGATLGTFAHLRIRGAMIDSLRAFDSARRETRRFQRKHAEARRDLEQELNRKPEQAEVAARLNLPVETLESKQQEAQASDASLFSLDDPGCRNAATSEANALDRLCAQSAAQLFDRELKQFSERNRTILRMRFAEEKTLEAIASVVGLSKAGVARVLECACRQIKENLLKQNVSYEMLVEAMSLSSWSSSSI